MKKHLLKTILLLFALVAGTGRVWAADETWTHTFVSPEAICDNSITVGNATWTVTTTKGQGNPTMTAGNSYSKYGLKFGSNRSVYYGSVTFSTDYFNSYNVKSVKINVLNNGKQEGTLTVKQGDVNIGSASQTFGNSWTDLTANTNTGAGGTLSFTYSVQQAFYINSITVTYTTGGGSSPDPVASIDLGSNSIEAPAAGARGTIEVTYNNITKVASEVQFFEADGTTPATYDWVNAEINETSNNVDYTIDANTGEARTAYMKVYALDDEANEVYSKLITITQAEIPTSWAAVKSIADLTASDVFVIVGDKGGSTFALSNDKGTSDAPTAVAVTVANNALSGTVADNIKWNISGNATDGYTFYPDGDTKKWLYCTNENKGVHVGTNTDKTFTLDASGYLKHVKTSRYVGIYNNQDWRCYTGYGGNIVNQTFAFYKKLAVKFNKEGYATFSSTCAIDYSEAEGYTAWVVTDVSATTITFSQVAGAVPAGTGVLLMGTAGETVYPKVAASGEAPKVNKLQGITTTTPVEDNAFYGLSGNEFVKVNSGTVPAGKALLPAGAVNGVKALSFRFDGADGISEIMTNGENEKMSAIYDLSGRRVVKPTKGLYIVNGKKVVK